MPAPYSLDLRQKVVSKYNFGDFTQEEICNLFGIGTSTLKRWHAMYKNTGNLKPITEKKGRPSKVDKKGLALIEQAVKSNNTITLEDLSILYFKKRKVKVGNSVLSRVLTKLNLNRKKLSVSSAEKDLPVSKKKRAAYIEEIKQYSVEKLIFIDEAGANLQMHPRYGRAPGAQRAKTSEPYPRGHYMTILGAISIHGIECLSYTEGPGNTEVFNHFIEKDLCKVLTSEHVVVMDNVSFHKSEKIRSFIESKGAKLIYTPPYSPEFNPIEEMWSKVKTLLRKFAARTKKAFKAAVTKALRAVTVKDLFGWFEHAGYMDQDFRKLL